MGLTGNGAGGTRHSCYLVLGWEAPERGILGAAGAGGSWNLGGEYASLQSLNHCSQRIPLRRVLATL